MENSRVPLEVLAFIKKDGSVIPRALLHDGKRFEITKIKSITSMHPAGVPSVAPIKYTVLIEGASKEIYYERCSGKWFAVREKDMFFG